MDKFTITVNGQTKDAWSDSLVEVVVESTLYLPSMAVVVLEDDYKVSNNTATIIDSEDFPLGGALIIKVTLTGESSPKQLFDGEITALEPVFGEDGRVHLRIRAYDQLHRLTRGKKTATYGDVTKTSPSISEKDIVSKVIQNAGLQSNIDASTANIKYHYVMQRNQTDLEFLWSHAQRLGYQIYAEGKKVNYQKADFLTGAEVELTWMTNLRRFEPRLSAVNQINTVKAYGWDTATKAAIVGNSTADSSKTVPAIGLGKKGSAAAQTAFGGTAEESLLIGFIESVDEANAYATARLAEAESRFIQAEGETYGGEPGVLAGRQVNIQGVGTKFTGKYYVSEARHIYSNGIYRVSFKINGRIPNTFSALLSSGGGGPTQQALENKVYGVIPAVVTSIEDPKKVGRVQVKFPSLPTMNGAELSSEWARMATPMAGPSRGFYYLPEINDEVLVAFENGDIRAPYIVGCLWNDKDKPPEGTAAVTGKDGSATVDNQRIIKSRSGHLFILDDTKNAEGIIIQDKTTKNFIKIDSKNNTMTINLDKDYTLVAKGNVNLQADGNIACTAKGDFSVECNNLNLKAKANVKIEGVGADVKASGQLNLQGVTAALTGDTKAEVKSNAMVSIQSSAITQVKGNPIMLN